jgi:hypothetical protein
MAPPRVTAEQRKSNMLAVSILRQALVTVAQSVGVSQPVVGFLLWGSRRQSGLNRFRVGSVLQRSLHPELLDLSPRSLTFPISLCPTV